MVGNGPPGTLGLAVMSTRPQIDTRGLEARIEALPGFAAAREAARVAGVEAFLVGGAVRDALLGRPAAELDLVVVGDPVALARALGGEVHEHPRFRTATAGSIDVAMARTETYDHPGALPRVAPADLEADIGRRDFSVNAIAVALEAPGELIDPHRGLDDLRSEVLRALHRESLADDPTRALRAARYAARLDLELEPETAAQVRAADLETVSADRVEAELRRLAREPDPRAGFELLSRWGLLALDPAAGDLIDAVVARTAAEPWLEAVAVDDAVLAALDRDAVGEARALAAAEPASASAAVAAAAGRPAPVLALARALGADWLDRYLREWRAVRLAISGTDLIAAGVPEGEAIGRGLSAALRAKLDGDAAGREDELRIAVEAAGI